MSTGHDPRCDLLLPPRDQRVTVRCGKCGRRSGFVAVHPLITDPQQAVDRARRIDRDTETADLDWHDLGLRLFTPLGRDWDYQHDNRVESFGEFGFRLNVKCRCGAHWRWALARTGAEWLRQLGKTRPEITLR